MYYTNYRLSAQVLTFPLTFAVKLLIYCRLAADVTESGDGAALTLSLTVGVVGLMLRGGPLIRS